MGRRRRRGCRPTPRCGPCPMPPCGSAPGRTHTVSIGCRPGGSSSTTVMSRSPKTTMAAVRGMGVAVMTKRSGSPPVGPGAPLSRSWARCSTPNRCCSSMTATPNDLEGHVLGQQRMGADHQVDRSVGQPVHDRRPFLPGRPAGEERDPQRPDPGQRPFVGHLEVAEKGAHLRRVLLGQDLGRRHRARPDGLPRRQPARPRRPPPSCPNRRRPGEGGAWAAAGPDPGRWSRWLAPGHRSARRGAARRSDRRRSGPSVRAITWRIPRESACRRCWRSTSASCRRSSSSKARRRRAGSTDGHRQKAGGCR